MTARASTVTAPHHQGWCRREWALLLLEGPRVGVGVGLALMGTGVWGVTAEPVTACKAVPSKIDTAGDTRDAWSELYVAAGLLTRTGRCDNERSG